MKAKKAKKSDDLGAKGGTKQRATTNSIPTGSKGTKKNNATVETSNPDTDNKLNKKVKVNSVNKYLIVKAETRTMEGKTNKPAYDGGLDPGELA